VGNGYVSTLTALSDEELRQQVIRDALRGLQGWRARYGQLEELRGIIAAIDEVAAEVEAT
jgi:hypothetical protein